MMNRALKAFPGMVISMLLASPAFAAGAGHPERVDEKAAPQRPEHAVEHRRTSVASVSAGRGTGSRAAVLHRGGRVTSASRSRRWSSRVARGGNIGEGTGVTGSAYLSDATDWAPLASAQRSERQTTGDSGNGFADGVKDADATRDQIHGRILQVGIASWYGGSRWQGHMTSMGTRYDDAALTAAHATLPLGSKVLVALPGSGRSVVVTITDRPGTRKRVIDLSRAAAAALGILERGTATVSLTPL